MNTGDKLKGKTTKNVESESVSASGACMTAWFGLLVAVVALRVLGVDLGLL